MGGCLPAEGGDSSSKMTSSKGLIRHGAVRRLIRLIFPVEMNIPSMTVDLFFLYAQGIVSLNALGKDTLKTYYKTKHAHQNKPPKALPSLGIIYRRSPSQYLSICTDADLRREMELHLNDAYPVAMTFNLVFLPELFVETTLPNLMPVHVALPSIPAPLGDDGVDDVGAPPLQHIVATQDIIPSLSSEEPATNHPCRKKRPNLFSSLLTSLSSSLSEAWISDDILLPAAARDTSMTSGSGSLEELRLSDSHDLLDSVLEETTIHANNYSEPTFYISHSWHLQADEMSASMCLGSASEPTSAPASLNDNDDNDQTLKYVPEQTYGYCPTPTTTTLTTCSLPCTSSPASLMIAPSSTNVLRTIEGEVEESFVFVPPDESG